MQNSSNGNGKAVKPFDSQPISPAQVFEQKMQKAIEHINQQLLDSGMMYLDITFEDLELVQKLMSMYADKGWECTLGQSQYLTIAKKAEDTGLK